MRVVNALWFDGRSTKPSAVSLWVGSGGLHIVGAAIERVAAASTLRFTRAHARAPARIDFADGAACEIQDGQEFDGLRKALIGGRGLIEHLETPWRYAVASLVVLIAALGACYDWGIPWMTNLIADRAPDSLAVRLGDIEWAQLERFNMLGPEHPLTPAEAQLVARFAALNKPDATRYRIVFRSLGEVPNAFALPNGTILITQEMETLAQGDQDALLFVLGHELGHLHYRHSLRQLTRFTILSAVTTYLVGDVSTALATAATAMTVLRYSRDAERQADAYGIALLRANRISTVPAARLFERLQAWHPKGTPETPSRRSTPLPPAYLSSHPATDERIHLLDPAGETLAKPAPNPAH